MMEIVQNLFKCADMRDSPDEIEFLLADGKVNINECWQDDFSLLMAAASKGHLQTVKLLLKLGADVNARSQEAGMTALMDAAEQDKSHVVEVLLASGADATMRDKAGWTASRFAVGGSNTHQMLKKAEEKRAVKTGTGASTVSLQARTHANTTTPSTNSTNSNTSNTTWLHSLLSDMGFAPELVALCQQKLVHEEAILSLERFARIPSGALTHVYLCEIGIKPMGVRYALQELHEAAVESAQTGKPLVVEHVERVGGACCAGGAGGVGSVGSVGSGDSGASVVSGETVGSVRTTHAEIALRKKLEFLNREILIEVLEKLLRVSLVALVVVLLNALVACL